MYCIDGSLIEVQHAVFSEWDAIECWKYIIYILGAWVWEGGGVIYSLVVAGESRTALQQCMQCLGNNA